MFAIHRLPYTADSNDVPERRAYEQQELRSGHRYPKYICRQLGLSNSYTMACPPVRGDNPRALASGLSNVQVDKHGITILYHLHQCRPCTSRDISC